MDILIRLYDLFPPRPKTPFTYDMYACSDISLSKGVLGSKGKMHLKSNFNFPTKIVTFLCKFRVCTHALAVNYTHLASKDFSIQNILEPLLFEMLQLFNQNDSQYENEKWGGGGVNKKHYVLRLL